MMLYKNLKAMVCLPNGDTNFFNIVAGGLQIDTLASYKFIISLDYVLWMSTDLIKENSFTLKKISKRWYPTETMTDADYADDLALLANTPAQAESLLHSLKQALGGTGLNINPNTTVFICFKHKWDISTLSGKPL